MLIMRKLDQFGYKTNDFYIFFSSNDISIYPNYNYSEDSYTEFENLVKEYSESDDENKLLDFTDKLTDIWPDYTSYNYDRNFVEITYCLRGVKIEFSSSNAEGIQIYENYNGKLKEEQPNYSDLTYKVDQNLIIENEESRKVSFDIIADDSSNEELKYSNIFTLEYGMVAENDERKNNINVRCKTGEYPDNTLDDTIIINDYIWADDSHLIYNIQGKGIYMYNAITRNTSTILEGEETYKIKGYDRTTKTLQYDEKSVIIKF